MRILCFTDLSPRSDAAIARSTLLARQLGGAVTLVHVAASTRSESAVNSDVGRVLRGMGERTLPRSQDYVAPEVIVRRGNPAAQVSEIVRQTEPALVVLGPHRTRAGWDRLGGSIAEKILRLGRCPVLIAQSEAVADYRKVLLALDLSPTAAETLRAAESLVLTDVAEAAVVHAFELQYEGMLPRAVMGLASVGANVDSDRVARTMRRLLEQRSERRNRYRLILSSAFPAVAITRAIERVQPDLLVMGTGGYGWVRRALLGSVASEVLAIAACDMLIVPSGSFSSWSEVRVAGTTLPSLGAS
jgi:universal stress protein E